MTRTLRITRLIGALSLLASLSWCAAAAGGPAYIRYPDLNGNRIVFAAEA